jgi:hypothetical protein
MTYVRDRDPGFRITNRGKRALLATVVGVPALLGVAKVASVAKANLSQPSCEVPMGPTDTVGKKISAIKDAGDNIIGSKQLVAVEDGHIRNAYEDPFVGQSLIVKPGDRLQVSHVDPKICIEIGGRILAQESK